MSNHILFGSSISVILTGFLLETKMTQLIHHSLVPHILPVEGKAFPWNTRISMTEAVDKHPSHTTGH